MEIANHTESLSFSSFNEQQARELFGLKEELKENLLEEWESRAEKINVG